MSSPYAPRIRAARGYAGLSQRELAARLEVEEQWVKRREADYIGKAADRQRIADACDVPVDFVEHGWGFQPMPLVPPALDLATQRLVRQLTEYIVTRSDQNTERVLEVLERVDGRLTALEPNVTAQAQGLLEELKQLASARAGAPAPGSADADASADAGSAKQGSSEPGSRGKRRTPRESAG